MTVQSTSIAAYQKLIATGRIRGLREKVLRAMAYAGRSISQRECWILTGHPNLPSITPRFAELLEAGLILWDGQSTCPVSKETVDLFKLHPNPDLNFIFRKPQKHPKLTKAEIADVRADLSYLSTLFQLRPGTAQLLSKFTHDVTCSKCSR